jgi:hypothetical protein
MNFNAKVTVTGTTKDVPLVDAPVNIRIEVTGFTPVDIPASSAAFEATFQVTEGTYNGAVTSLRADGTVVGSVLPFTFTATIPTASAFVAGSVVVDVTPVA